ncbi:MAG: hypothetical protein ACFFB3_17090 [Candidatus Hodarchaeota archaeon]
MTVNPFIEIADAREIEAAQFTIEDIVKATVRNALSSLGAKPLEKVSIALATIPVANPIEAEGILRDIIDDLVTDGEITSKEGGTYKGMLTILAKSFAAHSAEI